MRRQKSQSKTKPNQLTQTKPTDPTTQHCCGNPEVAMCSRQCWFEGKGLKAVHGVASCAEKQRVGNFHGDFYSGNFVNPQLSWAEVLNVLISNWQRLALVLLSFWGPQDTSGD